MTILTLSKYAQENISKSLAVCSAITAFVAAFNAKVFNWHGIVEIALVWREQDF